MNFYRINMFFQNLYRIIIIYYCFIKTKMESQGHKKWTRVITGNKKLSDVKNPLRDYIENEINKIDITKYPDRPTNKIDFSIGDPTKSPQFKPHPSNVDIIAHNVGKVDGYTDFRGYDEARQKIAKQFASPNYEITKDNVFLTAGGSMALWLSIRLLADEGDNFLFPSPGFPLSLVIAKSFGLTPKFYTLLHNKSWQADLDQMQSLIDEKTKFIYVNNPSNPLGSCWSTQHVLKIIEIARKKKLPLVVDEIYETVSYKNAALSFPSLSTKDVTIFKCSGLTKKWFGPGWRMGWLIVYGNQISNYLRGLRNLTNIILMPNTIMQASVKQIIQNPQNSDYLASRLQLMKTNQENIKEQLDTEPYCQVTDAAGALYLTIVLHIQKLNPTQIPDAKVFCKLFFAQQNVMIFPGDFFSGKIPFVRLTISCDNAKVKEFIVRFKRFCRKHRSQ